MRKEKDPDPDPYLRLTDPDADPGGPKYTDSEHCCKNTDVELLK